MSSSRPLCANEDFLSLQSITFKTVADLTEAVQRVARARAFGVVKKSPNNRDTAGRYTRWEIYCGCHGQEKPIPDRKRKRKKMYVKTGCKWRGKATTSSADRDAWSWELTYSEHNHEVLSEPERISSMSEATTRRVRAIGSQLAASGPSAAGENQGMPLVKRVAADSNGPRVSGKVVIITGANSALGIGRAAAHQFAQNGARAVYICDYDDTHLAAHQREMTAAWPEVDVHVRRLDAADENAVKEVVDDTLQRYGRLDIFFANAGIIGPPTSFADVDSEGFMETMRVNALGPFLAAKYAAPAMAKTTPEKPVGSGSIIMTSSVAGLRANGGPTPYSAAKAAVISMAQTLPFQLAGSNVRVNAICPGLIETGMTAVVYEIARQRGTEHRIGQLTPLQRGGNADEIARVALFLGSDESSYVNGQAWAVDGGLSASHPYLTNNRLGG